MRGRLRLVIDRAFVELWQPLTNYDGCPPNIFGEIYSGLRPYLREPKQEYIRADDGTIRDSGVRLDQLVIQALTDQELAEKLLENLSDTDFESESQALLAVTEIYAVLSDVATDDLANSYLGLLKAFIARYSLRYYVDDSAEFWMSFPGLATQMFRQIRVAAKSDPHTLQQLNAFEHTLAECLAAPVDTHIKTTIQKQVNVLEAFGSLHHGISAITLGGMLQQVDNWPHESLTDAALELYKFTNSYPGIRHGGTAATALRQLDLRDLTSVTFSLLGLVAYVADGFGLQVDAGEEEDDSAASASANVVAPWV